MLRSETPFASGYRVRGTDVDANKERMLLADGQSCSRHYTDGQFGSRKGQAGHFKAVNQSTSTEFFERKLAVPRDEVHLVK